MAEVLVVDDVPRNLEIVMQMLTHQGIDVAVAVSGAHALSFLERRRPDLILLDIAMPDMDGFEVCRTLKQQEAYRDIPVIFLTAKTDTADVVRGFSAGAVDYVRKPFVMEELMSRVTTHLNLRESYGRIQRQNREKDRYLSILAHDLRNPLNGFLNITEMLQRFHHDMEAGKISEYLQLLQDSSQGLVKLLENLLTWSRLQIGALEAQRHPMDLRELITETRQVVGTALELKNQTCSLVLPEDGPLMVDADAEMIRTVIRNLMTNAIKFTPEGGSVTVTAGRAPGAVVFTVQDSGQGLDDAIIGTLFQVGGGALAPGNCRGEGNRAGAPVVL